MSGRCKSCDAILQEKEMTAKDKHGQYLDLCFYCLDASDSNDETGSMDTSNVFYREGRSSSQYYE